MTQAPPKPGEKPVEKSAAAAAAAEASSSDVNHRTRVGAERRARTRSRILEAAAQVFAEKGADVPVIDDFIRAADVSRGTFYNHFRTTAELLDATIAWLADDVVRSLDPEVAAIQDDALRLGSAMRMYLRWAASDRQWCAFVAKIPQLGVIAERRVTRDLRRGLRSGAFKYSSIDAAHDLIVGASQQAIRRMAQFPAAPDHADEVVGMILLGLGVAAGRVDEILRTPLPPQRLPAKSASLFGRPA